jgi:PAS domain S-box-containing protein
VQDLYGRLVAFTHDGVCRYTLGDGRLLMANQGLLDILGLDGKPADFIGQRFKDLLVYTGKEGTVRRALERTGELHGFEDHFKTLQGADKWVLHDSFVVTDPATHERVVEAIVRDITARKRAEQGLAREEELRKRNAELEQWVRSRTAELEAANSELEAFCYSASHDLRGPLHSISGFAAFLVQDYASRLDPRGQDYLRRVCAAAARMNQLIDDLLRLSRLNRAAMSSGEVDLSAVAVAVVEELRQQAPDRAVDVSVAPHVVVQGDARLLREVLESLLGNAWKFTSRKPRAAIAFGATDDPTRGRTVCFVKDDGVGFDPAQASRLFTPFQRLHTPQEFPGSGIGLSIVKRIIRRHGGEVWAEGTPGQGATFYFTLSREKLLSSLM